MAELHIELIAVGDELLMGMTLDTNSHYIARQLSFTGLRLQRLIWVADRAEAIKAVLEESWKRSDIVIIMGGLGPTHDDLTRPAIADFFGDRLEVRPDLREGILERFRSRGLNPAPGWESMAEFPTNAEPIPNNRGAAPGIHFRLGSRELFAVPGVPSEMNEMIIDYILPRISDRTKGSYHFRVIKTVGIGESHLAQLIGDSDRLKPTGLAFLPSIDGGVTLRLSLYSDNLPQSDESLNQAEALVCAAVQPYIYAKEDKSLEEVIVDLMRSQGLRLGLAESCTGGMIAARIVNVSGSSEVLDRGVVAYSNLSKTDLLGISTSLIDRCGAVSQEVARAMAEGIRIRSQVEIGLSVTGVAGPSGASDAKPAGLTYIGLADETGCIVKRHLFAGNRDENRRRATLAALTMLYSRLTK